MLKSIPAYLAATALLAFTALLGGWPWALMAAIWVAALLKWQEDSWPLLLAAAAGLFWIALFRGTEDRRLFFPFSMQVAASVACLLGVHGRRPALAAGILVTAVFAVIRMLQDAGTHVLGVELIVAAAVVPVGVALRPHAGQWGASAITALLALAGLLV
ncbi:MAG: hypothetical protein QM757_31680 [Paludibaculum sp.]